MQSEKLITICNRIGIINKLIGNFKLGPWFEIEGPDARTGRTLENA